jgi:uncharacterized OB-fold protein
MVQRRIPETTMSYRRPRTCENCGHTYTPTYTQQRTCGRKCGEIMRRTITSTLPDRWPSSRVYIKNCDQCGQLFTSRHAIRKRCGSECAKKANITGIIASITRRYRMDPIFRDKANTAVQNHRATRLGLAKITTQAALITYLTQRDHGRCGICHKQVRARRGPMRPSIDHVTPLSRGGTHELANLQLAHYRCNLAKGNRGSGEQLIMIG